MTLGYGTGPQLNRNSRNSIEPYGTVSQFTTQYQKLSQSVVNYSTGLQLTAQYRNLRHNIATYAQYRNLRRSIETYGTVAQHMAQNRKLRIILQLRVLDRYWISQLTTQYRNL